jgi:hypothetical protein
MLKSKSRFWMHNEFLWKPNLPNNNSFCKWVIFSSSFVNSMILELVVLDWRLLTNKLYLYIYLCDMFQRWTREGYIICISHQPFFLKMTRLRAIVRWILLNLTNNKSIRHQCWNQNLTTTKLMGTSWSQNGLKS